MLSFLDKIPYGTPRIRRVAFWLVTSFLTYTLFGFLAAPPILKSVIVDQLSSGLNRATHVSDVYVNPLKLSIEVTGLKVDKLEGDGEFLSIDKLDASPGLSSIWNLAPVISYLRLHNFKLDITFFGDGRYSISDLMKSAEEEEAEVEEEGADAIFPFALYGFEMTNSTIVFDDKPHDKKHVISDLFLRVPFTSSFAKLRGEFTQPKFTAVVNGDPVELKGRTLPFHETLRTEFELGAVDIDLDQYWKYVPVDSPLQLKKGRFTSDISLFFERPDAKSLSLFLGGGGTLSNVELASPKDGSVLKLKALNFEMEKFSLGDRELVLTHVVMERPFFKVIRRQNNDINWAGYFPGSEMGAAGPQVKTVQSDEADFAMDIRKFTINEGALEWIDRAVPGGFTQTFSHFSFDGKEISTAGDRPSLFEASIGAKGFIRLKGVGTMKPLGATATLSGHGLQLPNFKPYLEQALPLVVDSGTVSFSAPIEFKKVDGKADLAVNNGTIGLNNLSLRKPDADKPSLGLELLNVHGIVSNVEARTITVAEVAVKAPMVKIVKEKGGQIDLIRLFAGEPRKIKPKKPVDPEITVAKDRPWKAIVDAVRITEGAVGYKDLTLKHPASLDFDSLKLDVDNVSNMKDTPLTYALTAQWGGRGSFSIKGKGMLDPLTTNGRLKLNGLGLRPLDGHLGHHTELLFASGSASADLQYTFTGGKKPKFSVKGSTALNKVRLKDNRGDGEFAGIKKLQLASIDYSNTPHRLSIGEINLAGPSVSIDYDENGHSNIRRAFRIPEPPPVTDEQEKKAEEELTHSKMMDAPKPEPAKSFFKKLDIGKIVMTDGHIRFRDASVKPTYYTEITDMNLGLIEVNQSQEARPKLDFKAKIGPTPMSIIGALNPVVKPMYSDLAIAVNGMELVPLSPYTIEHLAYPVEKGRLYADVTFKTEDWELQADNKFFIEQLVLGPKDKRPGAPNVPIKFGLAILQDGNGDMELNLPIRGRLDDPDFRIGGIVFKAIVSLMFKALASPFTLIGSIFGGGGENMDFVVFEPGRHRLDKAGIEKMDTVTKALKERDKLTLEVDGVVDPVADHSGLIEVIFEDKLKQQKYESLSRKERAQTTVDAMVVTPEEYGDILYEAYADEPDPEGIKPTTLFMTDRQPVEFMEKFILERIIVTEDDLNELARSRAATVKDHVISKEPELTERVFLLDRRKDKQGKTGVPKHRADLGIK